LNYYRDNALLARLKQISSELEQTWIPAVGEWLLVYGDEKYIPKFTCHVKELNVMTSELVSKGINQLKLVDHIILTIKDLNQFEIKINTEPAITLNGDSLIELYMNKSLISQGRPTWKGINKSSSSHYHVLQQRMNLLGGVIDIDLMRINADRGNLFFELKRSYIEPEKWMPFRADLGGYKLLSDFAEKNNGKLFIVYWKRQLNPWHEDLSKIKILQYINGEFRFIEYLNYSAFVEKYLLN
jgi:hypothetical protein